MGLLPHASTLVAGELVAKPFTVPSIFPFEPDLLIGAPNQAFPDSSRFDPDPREISNGRILISIAHRDLPFPDRYLWAR